MGKFLSVVRDAIEEEYKELNYREKLKKAREREFKVLNKKTAKFNSK